MDLDKTSAAQVAYFGHDLDDAAIRRRLDLFTQEGVKVRLGGFVRGSGPVEKDSAQAPLCLGRTFDSALIQRMSGVLRNLVLRGRITALSSGTQTLMARNLEMLVLAWWMKRPRQRLVYECLDIHRMMLGNGCVSRVMRWLERRLLARTDLVVTSSPAYAQRYFAERQGRRDRVLLVENKVPETQCRVDNTAESPTHRDDSPWVIGWFGMLRCRKTFTQLAEIARNSNGSVRVLIAGKPSEAEFPDWQELLMQAEGVEYVGRYSPSDLAGLYARVHFIWAIDYFEEGLNSDWLLPNRLYEGLANRAVPIALSQVETGRWLARHEVGLLVEEPLRDVPALLETLDGEAYRSKVGSIAALPRDAVCQTATERRSIVSHILGHGEVAAHG